MNKPFNLLILLLLALFAQPSFSKIKLPALLADDMVLQQKSKQLLWGWSDKKSEVVVTTSWNNKQYRSVLDASGKWSVEVSTPKAGGPFTIAISDGEALTLKNILVGEVWVCSGQSNMEMPLKGFKDQPILNSDEIVKNASNSQLRLFTVKRTATAKPQDDCIGEWAAASPKTAIDFSAVAFQFGKRLQDSLKVPVGLVVSSWGGTRIEPWIPLSAIKNLPDVSVPSNLNENTKDLHRVPTGLFNGMIHPLLNYTIKGVLWYQGESNREKPAPYAKLLPVMVDSWRSLWENSGKFPFFYVQIAPFIYGKEVKNLSAYLRESQLKASSEIPNSAMVVTMDVGSESTIHPPDKTTVAMRLSNIALNKVYDRKRLPYRSPEYKKMKVKDGSVILSFKHADKGLKVLPNQTNNFEIAGADKVFHPAEVTVLPGGKLVLKSSLVKEPKAVRYGFKNWVQGNLFNSDGLPASSFRTDNWDQN